MLELPPDDFTSHSKIVFFDRQSEPVWNAPGIVDLQSSAVIRDIDDDTGGLSRALVHDARVLEHRSPTEPSPVRRPA